MKKISRQRNWQKKKISIGLCKICGKKLIFKTDLCFTHYKEHKTRMRNRYRKKVGIPLNKPIKRKVTNEKMQ